MNEVLAIVEFVGLMIGNAVKWTLAGVFFTVGSFLGLLLCQRFGLIAIGLHGFIQ